MRPRLSRLFARFKRIFGSPAQAPRTQIDSLERRQLLSAFMGPQLPSRALTTLPHYDHVVIVMEENRSYSQILGAPFYPPLAFPPQLWPYITNWLPITQDNYIRGLADQGASFTSLHAETHPSQPNYLDLFSGSNQGIGSDATPGHIFNAPNLGGELIASGQSFAGYSESLPHTGYAGGDHGDWVRHHEPWVNFSDVPKADNLNLKKFPHDYTKLPTVSFVIPTNADNMHSDTTQAGDEWLKHHLHRYAHWAKTHNSLLIVTWDEAAGIGSSSNQVATIFYGAHIKRGQYSERINHFNVLRTIEDMYGLAPTGAAATATPITDVFGG